jgi:hypothetical protein
VIGFWFAAPAQAEELPAYRPRAPWVAPAGAEGFRVRIPGDRTALSTRLALVQDLDGAFIVEDTLVGEWGWRRLGLAAELAWTGGLSDVWASSGLGNLVVDGGLRFGRRHQHVLGVSLTLPVGDWVDPDEQIVAWWGTVPRATVPGYALALSYAGHSARWTWRFRLGVEAFSGFGWGYLLPLDASAAIATVQPLGNGWSVVGEAELFVWPDPLQLRALARHPLGQHWELDAGLAAPVPAIVEDPSIQLLGRLQRRW